VAGLSLDLGPALAEAFFDEDLVFGWVTEVRSYVPW